MSDGMNSIIQIGSYRVIAEIGSGGFGKVYQAHHTILTERMVAIKLLHSHLSSPEERNRFLGEARLLERLKHPNILHIFDVGIHEGFP
jgi:serine/threonine-protein kinase